MTVKYTQRPVGQLCLIAFSIGQIRERKQRWYFMNRLDAIRKLALREFGAKSLREVLPEQLMSPRTSNELSLLLFDGREFFCYRDKLAVSPRESHG